jgi:hypothetical protein
VSLKLQKKPWCQIEEECSSRTAIGIPIPKKPPPKLRSSFGFDKNLGFGFGFGIPQGSTVIQYILLRLFEENVPYLVA